MPNIERKGSKRKQQQRQMPNARLPGEKMRIKVPHQKHGLEEHEADQPHMGSAS
jgi:hypothetical protein